MKNRGYEQIEEVELAGHMRHNIIDSLICSRTKKKPGTDARVANTLIFTIKYMEKPTVYR